MQLFYEITLPQKLRTMNLHIPTFELAKLEIAPRLIRELSKLYQFTLFRVKIKIPAKFARGSVF
jgi:hypothetical protein